jgi:hypothetical protein
MGKQVLSEHQVGKLVERGMTPSQIADWYAKHRNIQVTPQAVSMHLSRRGIETGLKNRHADLLPWVLAVEHRNLYAAKMLRFESRRRNGEELPEYASSKLESWLLMLKERKLVVAYSPTGGWTYVARKRSDKDIIRQPR